MEAIANDNVVKYTITARSGSVDYVEIYDSVLIEAFFSEMQDLIL